MERQRKKDCDYLLKQETELEKMREGRQQALNYARAHEEQAASLKQVLQSTLQVKMKYENIIKLLVENEGSREFVLQAIEQTQNPTIRHEPTPKVSSHKSSTEVM